jgi:hypothetical protein
MGWLSPSIDAGQSMLCPYENVALSQRLNYGVGGATGTKRLFRM